MIEIRRLIAADETWELETLRAGWGSSEVARLGELVDAASLPGIVAVMDDRRVGLATYAARADGVEVVTIQALVEGRGVGTALMDRIHDVARGVGAPRLWLVTTNDNLPAIGFYRAWGMELERVVSNGVDLSRRVKPSIPRESQDGVAVRDELVFELRLEGSGATGS